MGYRVTTTSKCPNCEKVGILKKSDLTTESTVWICQSCGFHMSTQKRDIVMETYIDKEVIGKRVNIFKPGLISEFKNQNLIAKGSIYFDPVNSSL